MATQAQIDAHAHSLASVQARRDEFLDDHGLTTATVPEFHTGDNSLGFDLGSENFVTVIVKGVSFNAAAGFYVLPKIETVTLSDGSELLVDRASLQGIRMWFLDEGEAGVSDPFWTTTGAHVKNDSDTWDFGTSASGFFSDFSYNYSGFVMEDGLRPWDLNLDQWRGAEEVYAEIKVMRSGLTATSANDLVIYSGPKPDTSAYAIASNAYFSSLKTSGADTINGESGNDKISGGRGNDVLSGAAGRDKLDGGSGRDKLIGNFGKDTLEGGSGRDKLLGGGHGDKLNGGVGNDVLTGGTGADRFVFNGASGNDRIKDFTDGVDHIVIKSGASAFKDLLIRQAGTDAIVEFANVSILLENVDVADLGRADFIF